MKLLVIAGAMGFLGTPTVCMLVPSAQTCSTQAVWDGTKWLAECLSQGCTYTCSFERVSPPDEDSDDPPTSVEFVCRCPPLGGSIECSAKVIIDVATNTVTHSVCLNFAQPCGTTGSGKKCDVVTKPAVVNGVPGTVWVGCACK